LELSILKTETSTAEILKTEDQTVTAQLNTFKACPAVTALNLKRLIITAISWLERERVKVKWFGPMARFLQVSGKMTCVCRGR
jgi:hypothetical protein